VSVAKAEAAIDGWVDRFDPAALRRTEVGSRDRHLDVISKGDGSGLAYVEGTLYADDAAALNQRVGQLARGVCENDPRTIDQRRADALGAVAAGADRLGCACGDPQCAAADSAAPGATVVHVIAEERSLADDTPVQLDGEEPARPGLSKPLREMTIAEALAPDPLTGPPRTNPAVVIGGGIMPAPLLAAKVVSKATIRPLIHPGDAPPESHYVPSPKLADFVRCRDMTCRFPGCDEPGIAATWTIRSRIRRGRPVRRIWGACVENTTCSRRFGVGWLGSCPTAPSSGLRPVGRSTRPILVAGCCFHPCASPPRPSAHRRMRQASTLAVA